MFHSPIIIIIIIIIMDYLVALIVVSLAAVLTDDCGICYCSPSRDKIVCAGKGFTAAPELPKEALHNALGVGLQRNAISVLPAAFLNSFERLVVVDLRGQRTGLGCVRIDGVVRDGIEIIGKMFCLCFAIALSPASVTFTVVVQRLVQFHVKNFLSAREQKLLHKLVR